MATPTSKALIEAAQDHDLLRRFVALGAIKGLSQAEIEIARSSLVGKPIDESGNTIASVYEYAVANYTPKPRPGEDPAAVTDDQINTALDKIKES